MRAAKMPGLIDLPCELIFIILNYIPSRDVWQNVRITCRFLAKVIGDSSYWKGKLRKALSVELTKCQLENSVSFLSHCCAKVEEETERWKDGKLNRMVSVSGHDATVDAVALMKSSAHKCLCISGARDRALVIWDVDSITEQTERESWKVLEVPEAHQGWIWSVRKVDPDTFYSCAWDRYVKQWRINGGCVSQLCGVQMASAVLCVINDDETAVCSTFGGEITVMDARNSLQKITSTVIHRHPIFDLANLTGSHYLYSCCEDRRISCMDKRMWKIVNTLELEVYAQTMSLREGLLLCGTGDGKLISLDPETLTVLSELSVGSDEDKIRQVRLNIGSQICITRKRLLKMFTPGLRPKLFAESSNFDAEPSRFDYYDENLALACGNGSVLFWTR